MSVAFTVTQPPSGRFARTFWSLHNRNFKLFFFGQLISNTGNWLTMIALTLLVLHTTNSGLAVGLLTACQFGPILLFSAWAGSIADRSDKRRMLLFTQSGEMLQSIGLALLAFQHDPPLIGLYGVAVIGGLFLAFDNPVRRSFVPEMVQPDQVPNAVMLYSTIVNTSRVFGPTLAGALVTLVGYGWCFSIDALSYVAVLVSLAAMRPSELRQRPASPATKGAVREGLRYLRSMPVLWISFVMLAIVGTFSYNFSVVFPLFIEQGLGGSDVAYTTVYAVFSIGAIVGALFAANRGRVSVQTIVAGCAAFGLVMIGLALAPSVAWTYPIALLVGGASIIYMTTTTAIVQVRARPSMHGRVLALQTVLLIGTTPIGGPILGAISDRWGARTPVAVGAIAALGAAAWGWWAMHRHRDELDHTDAAAPDYAVSTRTVMVAPVVPESVVAESVVAESVAASTSSPSSTCAKS